LEFDALAVEFNRSYLKVNADGCNEGGCPSVVAEPEKEAGFANTC
jgi:hypothetical protein